MRASPTYAEAKRRRHLHMPHFPSSENVRSCLQSECQLRKTVYLKFRQRCQPLPFGVHRKSESRSNEKYWSTAPRTAKSLFRSVFYFCFTAIAEISTLALLTRAAA
jgi:hypothetical protein